MDADRPTAEHSDGRAKFLGGVVCRYRLLPIPCRRKSTPRHHDRSTQVHSRGRRRDRDGRTRRRGTASGPLAANRCPASGGAGTGAANLGTEVLRQGLQELGYVEGRTAVIEWRLWEGKPERLRDAVAEMVRLNPDVIVVGGSEGTKAMKEATRSIPIVFVGPSYPVEEGLVESFARPGGNITGITVAQSDHVAKMLQLLRDVVPALADVGVIWSPANPGSTFVLQGHGNGGPRHEAEGSAGAHGERRRRGTCLGGDSARPSRRADLNPAPIASANAERIAELAIRLRIPSITQAKALMERGLLMSYGADSRDVQRRIPGYVDRILKGAKPADMPVERPTKFELDINMKTAKAIGLTIPVAAAARGRGDPVIALRVWITVYARTCYHSAPTCCSRTCRLWTPNPRQLDAARGRPGLVTSEFESCGWIRTRDHGLGEVSVAIFLGRSPSLRTASAFRDVAGCLLPIFPPIIPAESWWHVARHRDRLYSRVSLIRNRIAGRRGAS